MRKDLHNLVSTLLTDPSPGPVGSFYRYLPARNVPIITSAWSLGFPSRNTIQ